MSISPITAGQFARLAMMASLLVTEMQAKLERDRFERQAWATERDIDKAIADAKKEEEKLKREQDKLRADTAKEDAKRKALGLPSLTIAGAETEPRPRPRSGAQQQKDKTQREKDVDRMASESAQKWLDDQQRRKDNQPGQWSPEDKKKKGGGGEGFDKLR